MDKNFEILPIQKNDYTDLSIMVGELLGEIMNRINASVFKYNQKDTEKRAEDLISNNRYWVFIAKELRSRASIGFVSLYESYALYCEGAYGTIPELYVRQDWRSNFVGKMLLKEAYLFAQNKKWHRIEVTTPPLPVFDRTLKFYQENGFEITGGRKLKIDVND